MEFKRWLAEVGGSGGIGGGLTPPLEKATGYSGAFADYHGKGASDPKNPNGTLPPVPQKVFRRDFKKKAKTLRKV
jgi:hypothetical protein